MYTWGMVVLQTILQWCANNPNVLFWLLLPSLFIFGWATERVLFIYRVRQIDTPTLKELIEYQKLAIKEKHDAETRKKNYFEILDKSTTVVSAMMYKYILSQTNFDNIEKEFTYKEYLKVGRQTKRKRYYKDANIFSVTVFLFIVWGGLVSFSHSTQGFYRVTTDGSLTTDAVYSILIISTIILFYITSIVLLHIYSRITRKYKIELFRHLGENISEFFSVFKGGE